MRDACRMMAQSQFVDMRLQRCDAMKIITQCKKVFALARKTRPFRHSEQRGNHCAASESRDSSRMNLVRQVSDDSALTVSGASPYKTATERGGAGANGPGRRAHSVSSFTSKCAPTIGQLPVVVSASSKGVRLLGIEASQTSFFRRVC
jgi:hypothetical protein